MTNKNKDKFWETRKHTMSQSPTPSEFALFQKLANPNKTDFSRRNQTGAFGSAVRQELSRPASVVAPRAPTRYSPPPREHSRYSSPRRAHSVASSRTESPPPSPRRSEDGGNRSYVSNGGGGDGGDGGDGGGGGGFPFNMPQSSGNNDTASVGGVSADLNAEIESEKQGYLLELVKFEQQGIQLTRRYSMRDALEEIQFEYERIRTHLDTVNAVSFMRDTVLLSFQGIELANGKWGPILELNGWAKQAAKDRKRYDHVLERLYKKHWRRGNMSPEMEFGWLVGSSMFMHHFQQKWGGGSGGGGRRRRSNSESDDDDSGGGRPASKFDLSSMLGGVLPKFPGMGGGGSARVPPRRPPAAPASESGFSDRPIMRGPSVPSTIPSEPPVVQSDPGPSTIRSSASFPPGGLAEHAHRFEGRADFLPPLPTNGLTASLPQRTGPNIMSGIVHAPVNVPSGLHDDLQQEHNKHALEREVRQMRTQMEEEMDQIRRMRQETNMLRDELRASREREQHVGRFAQHQQQHQQPPVVHQQQHQQPPPPQVRIVNDDDDDDDDSHGSDHNSVDVNDDGSSDEGGLRNPEEKEVNDDDDDERNISIVGGTGGRRPGRKAPIAALRLDL